MSDLQARIQPLLDELVASGTELGLQVGAYHHGELIVDAWAGTADAASTKPVDRDTLFTVYSVGKASRQPPFTSSRSKASSTTTTRLRPPGRSSLGTAKVKSCSGMPYRTPPDCRECPRNTGSTT